MIYIWWCEFANQESHLSKSFILGSPITNIIEEECELCEDKMDRFGYHVLSCPSKGLMTKRHDAICDKFYDYCVMAKLDVQKEQRYKDDPIMGKVRIQGRPGDIKINNYFTIAEKPKDAKQRNLHVDFAVVNIFSDAYIDTSSKKRWQMAKEKENFKNGKYHKDPNIMGIGIECTGFMSKNGKKIINYVADRLSLLRNEPKSIQLISIQQTPP